MVVITGKLYQDTNVDIIPDENKEFFWVKMIDIQNGLGIKNMPQMVRRDFWYLKPYQRGEETIHKTKQ